MTTDHPQTNATVHYQVVVDNSINEPFYYAERDTWEEAADDAVNADLAEWDHHVLKLKDGATIRRVR